MVTIQLDRALCRGEQAFSGGIIEGKAGRAAIGERYGIGIDDGIGQAAGAPD